MTASALVGVTEGQVSTYPGFTERDTEIVDWWAASARLVPSTSGRLGLRRSQPRPGSSTPPQRDHGTCRRRGGPEALARRCSPPRGDLVLSCLGV